MRHKYTLATTLPNDKGAASEELQIIPAPSSSKANLMPLLMWLLAGKSREALLIRGIQRANGINVLNLLDWEQSKGNRCEVWLRVFSERPSSPPNRIP